MISLSLQSSARRRPFQRSLVRASTPCYGGFTLSKDSSHGLRVHRIRLDSPCSDSLSLRLPFRLGLPDTVTRGLIMQKANGRVPKHAPIACGRTISGLFHSASSGSFRLSRSLSVIREYSALEGGPPGFGRSFTCSALLGILVGPVGLSAMGLSPAAAQLSSCVRLAFPVPCPSPATPGSKLPGLGSCAFARRYLRNVV